MFTRRDFLHAAGAAMALPQTAAGASPPIPLAHRGQDRAALAGNWNGHGSAALAAQRLVAVARDELHLQLSMQPISASGGAAIFAICGPWDDHSRELLRTAGVALDSEDRLTSLAKIPAESRRQGFVAQRLSADGRQSILLAAETPVGLRNALLTLSDRLYRDAAGNIVVDAFDGAHAPRFETRHIKTDAMNCGPFHMAMEYWDPTSNRGVHEFADWLASFRITDYALLAFVRGWGTSYRSDRFPALVDPDHPNSRHEFYPQLIDRMHEWGIKVWASDIYIASGYSMEVAMAPEMLSHLSDRTKLRPFHAGQGTFGEILSDPQAVACLSHPRAAAYYSEIVDDLLEHFPQFDGLDFHIGHTFSNSHKVCRCPLCKDLNGNRENVYRCFQRVYETSVRRKPDVRLRASIRMFADATRRIEEHHHEFPNLEFFCWLRWIGSVVEGQLDAPVTTGHEDGGGGLEAFDYFERGVTMSKLREYYRGWEAVLRTYVSVAMTAGLPGISWEPAFHRELEQVYFFYSQLTWEPELDWAELARRYVLRSERRMDTQLVQAYRLALESSAALTHWGLVSWGPGYGQFAKDTVLQPDAKSGLITDHVYVRERSDVQERVAALRSMLRSMGLADRTRGPAPVAFDLRWSLAKTVQWLTAEQLFTHH
jgi:hypothetical protein